MEVGKYDETIVLYNTKQMSLGILKGKTGSYLQNSQATIAKFSPKVDVFRNNIASNCRNVVTQVPSHLIGKDRFSGFIYLSEFDEFRIKKAVCHSDDYSFSNLRLINHE